MIAFFSTREPTKHTNALRGQNVVELLYAFTKFQLRHVRILETTRLPSWHLIFEYFCKLCPENSNFFKIWQEYRILCVKTNVCFYHVIMSLEFLLRMTDAADKSCRENQNIIIIIIIINIKDWTLWSVPSPKSQLLAPTLLRSPNCSPSSWPVVVWFRMDSVLWHSLEVWKPVPFVFIYLVWYACNP